MFYIVGTPIGNLEDLSIRQSRIIAQAQYILTEDTRSTGLLLQKIADLFVLAVNPKQKLISYYKEKEFEKLPQVLTLIKEGAEVVLISQAGMPLVSDPGSLLVRQLIVEQIPFTVIPGPTAFVTAAVYSGFDCSALKFLGFLPKKTNDLVKLIKEAKSSHDEKKDIVFAAYESPNRLHATLALFAQWHPQANLCICRELTKKFEEVVRGSASDLMKREYKGEITLVFT